MRIGFDASMLGVAGGVAAYAESLLEALAALGGHSIVLWCGPRKARPTVRRLAPAGSAVVEAGALGRLLGRLGRLAHGNPLPIESFVGSVDVFHAPNYLIPSLRGAAALVITVHDLSALRHPEWHPFRRGAIHRVALRRTARSVDHVITDSRAIRDEVLADLGVSPERVTAIPLAARPDFGPRPPAELKPPLARWSLSVGEYLLCAAALEPRKNLVRLIDAVAILRARRRAVPPLVIAGPPGWRNREIRHRMGAAGPGVRYLGYLPKDGLSALMAGCAAFVFPSLYEGFGLPVLEAMACGAPVVTSRGGALEEVAGQAAILVDPGDPEAIAAGIENILDDPILRETLARRSLARAAEFSWHRTAHDTLHIYELAIAARREDSLTPT